MEVGGITELRQPARQAAAKLSTTTLLHAMVGDEASEPVDELFHLTPLRRLLLERVAAESEEGAEDTWRIELCLEIPGESVEKLDFIGLQGISVT